MPENRPYPEGILAAGWPGLAAWRKARKSGWVTLVPVRAIRCAADPATPPPTGVRQHQKFFTPMSLNGLNLLWQCHPGRVQSDSTGATPRDSNVRTSHHRILNQSRFRCLVITNSNVLAILYRVDELVEAYSILMNLDCPGAVVVGWLVGILPWSVTSKLDFAINITVT